MMPKEKTKKMRNKEVTHRSSLSSSLSLSLSPILLCILYLPPSLSFLPLSLSFPLHAASPGLATLVNTHFLSHKKTRNKKYFFRLYKQSEGKKWGNKQKDGGKREEREREREGRRERENKRETKTEKAKAERERERERERKSLHKHLDRLISSSTKDKRLIRVESTSQNT